MMMDNNRKEALDKARDAKSKKGEKEEKQEKNLPI